MRPFFLYLSVIFLIVGCKKEEYDNITNITFSEEAIEDLKKLKLPPGFKIDLYADNVADARDMEYDPVNRVLYVGTLNEHKIYALVDSDGDYKADKRYLVAGEQNVEHRFKRYLPSKMAEKVFPGLFWPAGLALVGENLYVAEPYNIKRINNIYDNLGKKPDVDIVYDEFPMRTYHGWKYLRQGPDGKLYFTNGSTCDACIESDTSVAAICRMDADGSNFEVYAKGVRNSMGFDWHPETGNMWFSDNGVDHLGEEDPPDEINEVTRKGQHFGWPYIHGNDLEDVPFDKGSGIHITRPKLEIRAHHAALGLHFYTGDMFPGEYRNRLFIAEHGSRYRELKEGYRIMVVDLDSAYNVISYQPFIEGWLHDDQITFTDRPVDFEPMPDGSLLISSDYSGKIFRVSYDVSLLESATPPTLE